MKPAPEPVIGVKGCVNTQDGESLCHRFKAYGVVEGACGMCVVGLVPCIGTLTYEGVVGSGSSEQLSEYRL